MSSDSQLALKFMQFVFIVTKKGAVYNLIAVLTSTYFV